MKKIDFDDIKGLGYVAVAIIGILVLLTIVVLKVWIIAEYGDMPITEVPSWAIPWLTGGA